MISRYGLSFLEWKYSNKLVAQLDQVVQHSNWTIQSRLDRLINNRLFGSEFWQNCTYNLADSTSSHDNHWHIKWHHRSCRGLLRPLTVPPVPSIWPNRGGRPQGQGPSHEAHESREHWSEEKCAALCAEALPWRKVCQLPAGLRETESFVFRSRELLAIVFRMAVEKDLGNSCPVYPIVIWFRKPMYNK